MSSSIMISTEQTWAYETAFETNPVAEGVSTLSIHDKMVFQSPTALVRIRTDFQDDVAKSTVLKIDSGITLDGQDDIPVEKGLPLFYFPYGRREDLFEVDWMKVSSVFNYSIESAGASLTEREFVNVTLACRLSRHLNSSLFRKATKGERVTYFDFKRYWDTCLDNLNSEHSIVWSIMKTGNNLSPEDVRVVATDVTLYHRGLDFLSALPVFQNRYADTIIGRLFYSKLHNWNSKMTLNEFKKSGFYESLLNLENIDDVNATHDCFSYQHFYVIYCKFWEMDRDHDMTISLGELLRYDIGSMTQAILERVMEGCGKPLVKGNGVMTYDDFIWFILSVEDKRTPQAIEYWFRCLDLDGDGIISLFELRHFYEDQYDRMLTSRVSDLWKFEDFVCSL